ncbi:glycosyltransferase family 2 protein [Lichenicola cladoniae]|uniref:Glycosyltransferase family 2 protein n=1 Tax=Lichenicola cladoniae TaxID=1484109 RepID=A0A6M8HU81_9PROT|nr:glycosyltransferase family 2 protein [Lichenicola cladoniae]NPD67633.1 glycosyltransferase family 2 protein [Acetobacteraceae bacterium]QKE91727.1 glycosyltransferase family 2 protein [Lichenicola cladoniae]
MLTGLRALTNRLPPGQGRQCRAFLCVRDEADRLPYLLSYYRSLGVQWFFIIDDRSTDSSADYLRVQPDCSVFTTSADFGGANFGMDWINTLLEAYGPGHWCLFVDADELLVYPNVEKLPLPKLCDYLERNGYEGVFAFMLDMYSPVPVSEAVYLRGERFNDVCPLFDVDYRFRPRLKRPFGAAPFPPSEVVGGPRLRQFYPRFARSGAYGYAVPRGLKKLRDSRIGRALAMQSWLGGTTSPPLLSKMPLILGAPGRRWISNHKTTPLRLAPITGVLLHYKFFSDFHGRVIKALEQGQHFDGGSEYGRYASALKGDPNLCFAHPESRRYRSSVDLTRPGLLRTSSDYETFCSEQPVLPGYDPALGDAAEPVVAKSLAE